MTAIIVQIRIVVIVMMMVMVMSCQAVSLMRGVKVEVSGQHESVICSDTDSGTAFVQLSVWIRRDDIFLLSQNYHFFLRQGKSLQMEACWLQPAVIAGKRGQT